MRDRSRHALALAAGAAVLVLALAACGAGKKSPNGNSTDSTGSGGSITIGTTDQVVAIDPAGSYDNGSLLVEDNIYQFLMNVPAGQQTPQPDAAQSCSFTQPTEYTCTIKPGLKFSNGDPLTAADVAFSFTRIMTINSPNGPSSLLSNMKSVTATDDSTVVFTLNEGDDQTFPYILGTSAGPIVDSTVFPADKLLDDSQVVGSGPYKIASYDKNQLVQFTANSNYSGANTPKTNTITLKYYTQSSNMKLDVQSGQIDIAWRSLAPADIDSLRSAKGVKVLTGAGGEIRYMVYNFKTMPGDTDAQKLAIRQAVALSVDRQAIATNVYKDTYTPLYSMVPQGIQFATQPFKDIYGDKPDAARAKNALQAAGVATPVALNIQYALGHYGPSSDAEYGLIKQQLEATGLFTVNLQSAEWSTYSAERVKDSYPEYQLGWFPDYVNADNFLSPFLVENNFVNAHYCDAGATNRPCDADNIAGDLATQLTSADPAARQAALANIQLTLATGQMPYLPLLQGSQVAATRSNISGVQETLDPTYQFRFWLFGKS
ncbi:MAG: ABC transporter substrate-binding protein [Frankiaceae bacterium]|nr:ABC transporter substrate-binding protein [Frankiaceae bacterium]